LRLVLKPVNYEKSYRTISCLRVRNRKAEEASTTTDSTTTVVETTVDSSAVDSTAVSTDSTAAH